VESKQVHGSHVGNVDGNLIYFSFTVFDTS